VLQKMNTAYYDNKLPNNGFPRHEGTDTAPPVNQQPRRKRVGFRLCLSFLFFFRLFGNIQGIFALPSQKIVYPEDWLYEALAVLSREQGIVFFADSTLTVSQIERMLTEINEETLSPGGQALYDRINARIRESPGFTLELDALSVNAAPALQPEFYFKTNSEPDWIYNYRQRQPFFILPVNLSLGPYITAEMVPFLGQNEYAATVHSNYVNFPYDAVSQIDLHFPKRAYLSAGVPFGKASGVHFALGIGDDFFGRTRTGSVILSDTLEKINYAQLSLFSPYVKYTAEVMQYGTNKYQYMHYLLVRPYKTVSVSFIEGVMVNAPLELRYLNPMMIFHSYESWKTYDSYNAEQVNGNTEAVTDPTGGSRIGSYFGVKLEYLPVKHLRLYGLLAMTQLQLGIERRNWSEDLTPNALGFQWGTEASVPIDYGYWLFGVEGVYTYPYMYVLYNKEWSFYKEYPEVERTTARSWTGTPFGPDSIAGALWAGYHNFTRWSCEFSFVFAAQGERSGTDVFDGDYRPDALVYDVTKPPTGTPTYTSVFSVTGEWSPYEWLSFSLQPGYKIVNNYGHHSGRTEHGFEITLSSRIKTPVKKMAF
jgi:hypothetical protein